LTRSRGMLAHLLWSLPSVCAYLLVCRGSGVAKKSAFLAIFLLTMFETMLKYTYVCQQANITCPEPVEGNRQQAKDIAENRTNRPAPNRLLPPYPALIEC